ncbi:MAG: hypothetical protein WCA13_10640 [Terriglobales bacterium]
MRFHFDTMPLSGMTDVISIQAIGMTGDNHFVIEAETEEEATQKLLDLLEKRVLQGWVRPATEDEAKEFEEEQHEAYRSAKFTAELVEKFKKDREGVANGEAK